MSVCCCDQNHIDPNKTIEQSKAVTRIHRMNVNNQKFVRLRGFTLDFTSGAPEGLYFFFSLIFVFISIEWKQMSIYISEIYSLSNSHYTLPGPRIRSSSSESLPLNKVLGVSDWNNFRMSRVCISIIISSEHSAVIYWVLS